MKAGQFLSAVILISLFAPFVAANDLPSFNKSAFAEQSASLEKTLNRIKLAQEEDYDPMGLIKAVTVNNLPWVKEILAKKLVNLEKTDDNGRTALMLSTRKDVNIEIMHLLIKANANILAIDNDGRTPLVHATRNGNTPAVPFLMRAGSDVNKSDNFQWTPMMYAVANHDLEMVKALEEYHPVMQPILSGGNAPIFLSVEEDDMYLMAEVMIAGANLEYHGPQNMTPLMYAAYLGKPKMLSLLLRSDVDVNASTGDSYDRTALMYAAGMGHIDCVRILLNYNADRNQKDANGNTAYNYAVDNKQNEIASILRMP